MSKYKIGDKVRIKSIEWYNQNKDSFGLVLSDNDTNVFCYNMQKHCGEELTVRHISENGRYVLMDKLIWSNDGWPSVKSNAPSILEVAPYFQK